MTFTLEYADNEELILKLSAIGGQLGFVVTRAGPERISVGELAKLVKRRVSTVCRSLHRPSCPPFECGRGKRNIVWLVANERLIHFLTSSKPTSTPQPQSTP